MNRPAPRGFTLVEVMVALAVVAVALPALMLALNQQIDGTAYLRDKSLANMVAANKLEELRLISKSTRSLPTGESSGVRELADREWYWWRESTPQPDNPNFYRVEIRVAQEEELADEPMITLVAFMSADFTLSQLSGAPGTAGGEGGEGGEGG
ncbi:MAG: type II secretion system minor pseudopilin GspI [Halioglobus sp.]